MALGRATVLGMGGRIGEGCRGRKGGELLNGAALGGIPSQLHKRGQLRGRLRVTYHGGLRLKGPRRATFQSRGKPIAAAEDEDRGEVVEGVEGVEGR
jgi:hypothetical protein